MVATDTTDTQAFRLVTPGHQGWERTAWPADPRKYFMVSADCHCNEPPDLWARRIDKKYRHRIPRQEVDANGVKWQVTDGFKPMKIRDLKLEGEDKERDGAGKTPAERIHDHDRDGIDVEIMFPNKGLTMYATADQEFSLAMCAVWNDWAYETFSAHADRILPMAAIAPAAGESAVQEIHRVARLGFKGLFFPTKPIWGTSDETKTNYNLPDFDPIWQAVSDTGLPITLHVATGRDPRGARGNGGAVINYAIHGCAPGMEPIPNLCASGVLDRFPRLRFATIEAGIGWLPWLLDAMDEGYRKHHMWAFPKLSMLPSEYYRQHFFSSFQEDYSGITLAREYGILDNLMWGNDYPHHEGTWPHSAEAIERTMGHLTDDERARVLGLNAARFLNIAVPAHRR